jgi:hypothetical protein
MKYPIIIKDETLETKHEKIELKKIGTFNQKGDYSEYDYLFIRKNRKIFQNERKEHGEVLARMHKISTDTEWMNKTDQES